MLPGVKLMAHMCRLTKFKIDGGIYGEKSITALPEKEPTPKTKKKIGVFVFVKIYFYQQAAVFHLDLANVKCSGLAILTTILMLKMFKIIQC